MSATESTSLTGRVALVTGGSRGIGAATARRLGAHGAAVAVNYHSNADAAGSVVEAIEGAGGKAVAVGGDAAGAADVARVVDETTAALGAPDILVLSATGISRFAFGPLTANDPDDVAAGVADHVRAILLPVRAAAPAMAERGGGSIVVVSAANAGAASDKLPLISIAKAAVDATVRNLAVELGPRGIRVNTVAPGFVRTDASAGHVDENARNAIAARTPLRRTCEPDDVAAAVLSLLTGSAFVTGATLKVDGGMTA
ncbi:MAG TPA: SDR family oxidoreductase [Streptosporangiales bacterium]